MTDIEISSEVLMLVKDLIQSEEHARASFLITQDFKFLKELSLRRELRRKYMPLIEKEEESQNHCLLKHDLGVFSRLLEVGDKFLDNGDEKKATECYIDASCILEKIIGLNSTEENSKNILEIIKEKLNGR